MELHPDRYPGPTDGRNTAMSSDPHGLSTLPCPYDNCAAVGQFTNHGLSPSHQATTATCNACGQSIVISKDGDLVAQVGKIQ